MLIIAIWEERKKTIRLYVAEVSSSFTCDSFQTIKLCDFGEAVDLIRCFKEGFISCRIFLLLS